MKIQLSTQRYRLFMYVGLPGILLVIGVIAALSLITPSLTEEEAKQRIRICLARELSQRHLAVLEETGRKIPDYQEALQWQEQIRRVRSLRFTSVSLRRPLPDIILAFDRPTTIVRVTILAAGEESVRYFWLSWAGVDREISRFFWYCSI